jgi:hypothetical protein
MAISYIQRAPTSLFGMDTMMNLLMLYLIIAPSGAALSVDRLWNRYWATRQALRKRRPAPALTGPAPRVSANLALRCIQVNVCIIYLAAGLSKLQGQAWWNFNAVWLTMANPEFSPLHIELYTAFLRFLCEHRLFWELFMTGGVTLTLIMEIGFPFLVWTRRLRWFVLTMAVMLHIGIAVFMGLNTFSLMMLTLVLSFLPQEALSRAIEVLGAGAPRFQLAWNHAAPGHARAASLVRAVDPWDQVSLVDERSSPAPTGDRRHLHLYASTGDVLTGYALFQCLARSLRLLRPLASLTWLPGFAAIGRALFPEDAASSSHSLQTEPVPPVRHSEKVAH